MGEYDTKKIKEDCERISRLFAAEARLRSVHIGGVTDRDIYAQLLRTYGATETDLEKTAESSVVFAKV